MAAPDMSGLIRACRSSLSSPIHGPINADFLSAIIARGARARRIHAGQPEAAWGKA